METISFNNNGISPGIRIPKELKKFLISIFKKEEVEFKNIFYVFCRDDYLLSLNQKFLHHDTLTDILTFTLSDVTASLEAEIYISVERVRENAGLIKVDYREELFRVMIHGILHLCGYLDNTPKQKLAMRKKENFYLSLLVFHVKRST